MSQSGNLVGNSLVGTCLTLPNLGFLWVFFKYPKISKNGNPLFFPVNNNIVNIFSVPAKEVYKLAALIFDTQKSGKRLIKLMQY